MPDRIVPKGLLGRLGRRGAALLLIGTVWLLQGLIVWGAREGVTDPPHSPVPHENLPFPFLGALWAISGLLAGVHAFRRSRSDHPGWVGASAPPLVITASYLVAGVTSIAAGNPGGPTFLLASAGWSAITLLVGVLAGWPEPCPEDHTKGNAP